MNFWGTLRDGEWPEWRLKGGRSGKREGGRPPASGPPTSLLGPGDLSDGRELPAKGELSEMPALGGAQEFPGMVSLRLCGHLWPAWNVDAIRVVPPKNKKPKVQWLFLVFEKRGNRCQPLLSESKPGWPVADLLGSPHCWRSLAFALSHPALHWAGLGWARLCWGSGRELSPPAPQWVSLVPLLLPRLCLLPDPSACGGAVVDQEGCVWAWSVFCSSLNI